MKRSFSEHNKQAFKEELALIDWTPIYSIQDTQEAFSTFHQRFCDLFNKHFPKRKVKVKFNNHKPWLSDSLKRCIKHKNRLYYKSVKVRTAYNELMYTTYRNKLKNILGKAEQDYYAKLLEANKSNMRKTWSIIKQVINKKKQSKCETEFKLNDESTTTDQNVISEKFNDFFINIGPNLAAKIPPQTITPEHYLGTPTPSCLLLEPVTMTEFEDIIKSLKNVLLATMKSTRISWTLVCRSLKLIYYIW